MANFLNSVKGVLIREGVASDIPGDAGGITRFGISQRAHPNLDIANISRQDAVDIYADDYWDQLRCDLIISQAVADVVFDFGVNAGVKRSAKTLQKCLDGVSVDGYIGKKTLTAANAALAPELVLRFTLLRISYYASIASRRKSQLKFLSGWINRAIDAAGGTGRQ